MADETPDIEAIHRELQKQFNPASNRRFTSTATIEKKAEQVEDRLLPDDQRGRLPVTRSDYVIPENPFRVAWEREVRKFLSKLNHSKGHKITAPMIYEWCTGVNLVELAKAEGVDPTAWRGGARWGSANIHLRHINAILTDYFGKPRKTTIAGRHVGRAYDVPPEFRVSRKRPSTITLIVEREEGTLNP